MMSIKSMMTIGALLCLASLGGSSSLQRNQYELTDYHAAPHAAVEHKTKAINPRTKLSWESDSFPPRTGPTVTLTGLVDATAGKNWVAIRVVAPIYNASAEAPELVDERMPDTDDIENIHVYIANVDRRLLEVRFNRFSQFLVRMYSRPHNLLRADGLATVVVSPGPTAEQWAAEVMVDADYMPANFTLVSAAVVNPLLKGGDRYTNTYRIYNHALSIMDLQVVGSFLTIKQDDVLPSDVNDGEYSPWWDDRTNN